ncbi:MAG: hypothetical protein IT537_30525 [Hyphomicrobiales bacterium]|nr:hypothetical protein [Hyphomicrobiales bacterium]
MERPAEIPAELSLDALRWLLGDLSKQRISQLVDEGLVERLGQDRYSVGSVPAVLRAMRQAAAGPRDWQDARTELARERAAAAKMKREEIEGDLLPTKGVLAWTTSVARTVTTRLLMVPTKVAPRLVHEKNAGKIEAIIREAISEALEEIAKLEVVPDRPARPRKAGDAAA